jgi:hypothetical protein
MQSALILFFVLTFTFCNGQQTISEGDEKINELSCFRDSSFLKGYSHKGMAFVVEKKSLSLPLDTIISNYVNKIKGTINGAYDQVDFLFFLQSKTTNEEHLNNYPMDFYSYSLKKDLVWEYNWYKKEDIMMWNKVKKGKIIYSSSKVKIEDIQ